MFGPEVSKTEGRVAQTTNVVIGGTVTDDSTNEWLALDQKVKCSHLVHLYLCYSSPNSIPEMHFRFLW